MNQRKSISGFYDRASAFKARERIDEHEFDVWLVNTPPGYDGATNVEANVKLKRIVPPPRVVSKPLDTVVQREGEGLETARLQRYLISSITRTLEEAELSPSFFIIVPIGTVVTPASAVDLEQTPRYVIQGSPNRTEHQFSVMVVETKVQP